MSKYGRVELWPRQGGGYICEIIIGKGGYNFCFYFILSLINFTKHNSTYTNSTYNAGIIALLYVHSWAFILGPSKASYSEITFDR